jgi:hypothetical protein
MTNQQRNPSHWIYSDEPYRSLSWGFFTPAGKTIDGALVNDSSIDTHSALALKSKLVPDDPAAARFHPPDTQAKHLGYFQYLIHKRRDGNKVVIEIGTVRKGHTAIMKAAKDAYRWLTTGYGSKFPVEGGVADFMDLSLPANHQYIVAYGDTFKELLAGIMEVAKGLVVKGNPAQQRNGLHHLDSPNKWPEGWDDFTGYPWGFVKGTRDENGLDDDEQVDNHDTLAYQMGYKQGEDDALDHGWVRYLFTRSAAKSAYGNNDAAGNIWLNLSMIGPFPQRAKSVLHFIKSCSIEPDTITCHFRNTPDSLDNTEITGSTSVMTGVFTRIAKGEEPHEVKRALGIRNPAYAHDTQAREWGWIKPDGSILSGLTATIHPTRPRNTHEDLAQSVKLTSAAAFDKGWVRFAVLRDGSSLFTISGLTEALTLKALKNVAHFIHTSPVVAGEVQFDLFMDWAPGEQAYTATFNSEEHAYTVLSLMASGKRWPTGKERIWQSLDSGRKSSLLEDKFQYAKERESNPTYLGSHHPFKLHGDQSTGPLTAEFHDHTKYLITRSSTTHLWSWKLPATGERGESRHDLESVLTDLDLRAKRHTGRLGGAMKFVVFSQSGVAVGTVSAPDKDAAVQALVPQVAKFGARTTQSLYLYPYISASKEIQWAADQGVKG